MCFFLKSLDKENLPLYNSHKHIKKVGNFFEAIFFSSKFCSMSARNAMQIQNDPQVII